MTALRVTALVVAAVAMTAVPARADMACFSGPMQPTPMSSGGVAGSGGVIIASGGELPDWRFRAGNRLLRGEITKIAPGLALYHPPPAVPGVALQLESTDGTVHVTAARALQVGPIALAPVLDEISQTVRDKRVFVTARFTQPAPAGTVIAIVSRAVGGKLTPLAWAPIRAGEAAVLLWHTPGYCDLTIPQAVPPKVADTVVVSWVDAGGRVSEPSKPIVISKASARK